MVRNVKKRNVKKAESKTSFDPKAEIGRSGLNRSAGIITEEWLTQLNSLSKSNKAYREMRDNEIIVGAFFFIVDMLCRQVTWSVIPGGKDTAALEKADFLESCLDDLDVPFPEVISSALTMLWPGWAALEKVYKIRGGPLSTDVTTKSKYNDNKFGWRKLPLRSQTSLDEWVFDNVTGELTGFYQVDPVSNQKIFLPIEKLLHFRTSVNNNNPQGRSILRNAYRSYYYKKNFEEMEAIDVEHNALGVLVGWVPPNVLSDSTLSTVKQSYQDAIEDMKRNETSGMLWPLEYDQNGNKKYDIQMLSMTGSGNNTIDIGKIIERYDTRIAQLLMIEFIMLGTQKVGSFALADNKTNLFSVALGCFLDIIQDTFNNNAVPELFLLNGDNMEMLPKISHEDIETIDLKQLGDYIKALSQSGVQLFPNVELTKKLMRVADLPEPAEEDLLMQQSTTGEGNNNPDDNPDDNTGNNPDI